VLKLCKGFWMRFGETFERNYRKIVLTGTIGQKTNFKFCRAHLLILSISYTGAFIDASGTDREVLFSQSSSAIAFNKCGKVAVAVGGFNLVLEPV
jgi:hypothetical protein